MLFVLVLFFFGMTGYVIGPWEDKKWPGGSRPSFKHKSHTGRWNSNKASYTGSKKKCCVS
ncbi:hypothetical protein PGT21_018815 [Puccinia graminis f. sp. tritici]|uniref:Uncharacterized protein n=1 Tax=Puccinia graminis f. sp. tritici TaxID=56615 RepID=A0A5B0PJP3_PUCGR|nr:hypothetical protein PGT21_018815 [Puccinia graminis f. sp. tritici]KAA1125974.1 hypothetical protein PGTUg99_002322 [Puccinia graminis f. sp. tritici]KAA1136577.1 hypothetical protein PGTUg99_035747 [Puccinia graminis f. sp. tritici]